MISGIKSLSLIISTLAFLFASSSVSAQDVIPDIVFAGTSKSDAEDLSIYKNQLLKDSIEALCNYIKSINCNYEGNGITFQIETDKKITSYSVTQAYRGSFSGTDDYEMLIFIFPHDSCGGKQAFIIGGIEYEKDGSYRGGELEVTKSPVGVPGACEFYLTFDNCFVTSSWFKGSYTHKKSTDFLTCLEGSSYLDEFYGFNIRAYDFSGKILREETIFSISTVQTHLEKLLPCDQMTGDLLPVEYVPMIFQIFDWREISIQREIDGVVLSLLQIHLDSEKCWYETSIDLTYDPTFHQLVWVRENQSLEPTSQTKLFLKRFQVQ